MIKASDMRLLAESKKRPARLDYSVISIIEKNVLRAAEEARHSVAVTLSYNLEAEEQMLLRQSLQEDGYTVAFNTTEGFFGINMFMPSRTVVVVGWAD